MGSGAAAAASCPPPVSLPASRAKGALRAESQHALAPLCSSVMSGTSWASVSSSAIGGWVKEVCLSSGLFTQGELQPPRLSAGRVGVSEAPVSLRPALAGGQPWQIQS